jgi:hypothetical protein
VFRAPPDSEGLEINPAEGGILVKAPLFALGENVSRFG